MEFRAGGAGGASPSATHPLMRIATHRTSIQAWTASYTCTGCFVISAGCGLDIIFIHTPLEIQMPQNAKDSKGGKSHPTKETGANGGKKDDKGSADRKSDSPTGSHHKGDKKTTP